MLTLAHAWDHAASNECILACLLAPFSSEQTLHS